MGASKFIYLHSVDAVYCYGCRTLSSLSVCSFVFVGHTGALYKRSQADGKSACIGESRATEPIMQIRCTLAPPGEYDRTTLPKPIVDRVVKQK